MSEVFCCLTEQPHVPYSIYFIFAALFIPAQELLMYLIGLPNKRNNSIFIMCMAASGALGLVALAVILLPEQVFDFPITGTHYIYTSLYMLMSLPVKSSCFAHVLYFCIYFYAFILCHLLASHQSFLVSINAKLQNKLKNPYVRISCCACTHHTCLSNSLFLSRQSSFNTYWRFCCNARCFCIHVFVRFSAGYKMVKGWFFTVFYYGY